MADLSKADLRQLSDTSRDPVVTDGDKYTVLMENERVRVLEYRDSPGQRTTPHYHPDYVLCALSSFKRRLTLSDERGGVVKLEQARLCGERHSRTSARTWATPTPT